MDTVTYPDSAVREAARPFVCIRVEHDRSPELVKQYGVKGLPDVRLLDPEGRETSRLRGFTSAQKLAAALRGGAAADTPKAEVREVPVTPGAVAEAVKKGAAFLQASDPKGAEDLALFALAASGATVTPERVKRALDAPLTRTYQVAFRALALSKIDPEAHKEALQACAKFLVDTQLADGEWTYGPPAGGQAPPALGDHSNSAYGLLGLAACRHAGIVVPRAALEKAEAAWRKSQNPDGGWGYRTDRETESYASMTESALSSLLLCEGRPEKDLGWLEKHLSASENLGSPYPQGRLLYHLYALERLGTLLGSGKLGGHDWYREGAAFLLGTQRPDGSWDDGADLPVPNTAFAILFLTRATESLR